MRVQEKLIRTAIALALVSVPAAAQQAGGRGGLLPGAAEHYSRLFLVAGVESFQSPRFSPDGRWIAFSSAAAGQDGVNIWIVRSNGGAPVQVTTGAHQDTDVAWFPSGDRIAFMSNRATGVMTVGIDRSTRRASGPLKRVTVDSAAGWLDVSPDGQSIVYSNDSAKHTRIRVVPANGGPARELVSVPGVARFFRYSPDGKFIYFVHVPGATIGPRTVSRLPASGGAATVVATLPGSGGVLPDPAANRILVRDGNATAHILTLVGDTIATVGWARGIQTARSFLFARDGNSLITATHEVKTSIHVVPFNGGPIRVLTPGTADESLLHWRGNQIFYSSNASKKDGLFSVTPDGKKTTFHEFAPKGFQRPPNTKLFYEDISMDGRNWIVMVADSGPLSKRTESNYVYDSRTKTATALTGAHFWDISVPGSSSTLGWSTMIGSEWIYGLEDSSSVELRAMNLAGSTRTLRTIRNVRPKDLIVAYALDRVAYRYYGDSAVHMVVGTAAPKEIIRITGGEIAEVIFSPDGRTLYVESATGSGSAEKHRAAFLNISPTGVVAEPIRWIDLPGGFESAPVWSPNSDAVFVSSWARLADIWRIPVKATERAQLVSQRETANYSWFVLSPDGKEAAVAADVSRGTLLWNIDIKAAAAKRARTKR